jgi:hypothetical protein
MGGVPQRKSTPLLAGNGEVCPTSAVSAGGGKPTMIDCDPATRRIGWRKKLRVSLEGGTVMNAQQRKQAEDLLDKGYGYAEIADQIGGALAWHDVLALAQETKKFPWRGAMTRINRRAKALVSENDPARRRAIANEVQEYARRLYDCARKAQSQLDAVRRVVS